MNRRELLTTIAASTCFASCPVMARTSLSGAPPNATQWRVRTSEGFDAIAFLGPLSGQPLYQQYYAADVATFAPHIPESIRTDLSVLWRSASDEGFGLLGPNLQVIFSGSTHDLSLHRLLTAIQNKDASLLPSYRVSRYWSETDWRWFSQAAPRVEAIFASLIASGFEKFWRKRSSSISTRTIEVQQSLEPYDVISWQRKLTGRNFDPAIDVVLLQFAKPHGIKVQGQTFLQSADYDTATTVRIAAHEMMHPPFDPAGSAAQAAIAVFREDPLVSRILRDHDPKWGYTTVEGLLDEDLVEALDQLISEILGVARDPAERWTKNDDGIHVIAAGLYSLLRDDGWAERGGSIERWLERAAHAGRLKPPSFHQSIASVLKRPTDNLWPVHAASTTVTGRKRGGN